MRSECHIYKKYFSRESTLLVFRLSRLERGKQFFNGNNFKMCTKCVSRKLKLNYEEKIGGQWRISRSWPEYLSDFISKIGYNVIPKDVNQVNTPNLTLKKYSVGYIFIYIYNIHGYIDIWRGVCHEENRPFKYLHFPPTEKKKKFNIKFHKKSYRLLLVFHNTVFLCFEK